MKGIGRKILEDQRQDKLRRRKLIEEKEFQKVESLFIGILLQHERHESLAWKTKQEINQGLANVKSNSNRMKTLKHQTTMHAKVLGFSEIATKQTDYEVKKNDQELIAHLKKTSDETASRTNDLPSMKLPERKSSPELENLMADVLRLDDEQDSRKKIRSSSSS